jgi:hypothetical protein
VDPGVLAGFLRIEHVGMSEAPVCRA